MAIQRRGFLTALAGAIAAPAVIRTSGLLMPIKPPPVSPLGWQPSMILTKVDLLPCGGFIWVKKRDPWAPWTFPVDTRSIFDSLRSRTET